MAKKKKILTCDSGDTIVHQGKEMVVCELITPGRETYMVKIPGSKKKRTQFGKRDEISAFPVADNGQIMTRSPSCIGSNWEHTS